eukprot:4284894-Prymnesium_polylepis.1
MSAMWVAGTVACARGLWFECCVCCDGSSCAHSRMPFCAQGHGAGAGPFRLREGGHRRGGRRGGRAEGGAAGEP